MEYISRKDVLAVFGDVHPMDYNANAYIEKIKAIPSVNVVERNQWIPVTERLPEEDTSCLVFLVGGEFSQLSWMSMAIFYNGVFRYDDHSGEFDQITHWMPLPESPESEGTKCS